MSKIGETYINHQKCLVEIVEKVGDRYSIIFDGDYSTLRENMRYQNIQKGEVKNLFFPSVHGVGFLGKGKHKVRKNKKLTKKYLLWMSFMSRCYNEKFHLKQPSYKECTVTEEWHNFQNFGDWFNENYDPKIMESWHLDKDMLSDNSKVYSPKTCCFIPREINNLINKSPAKKSNLHQGVTTDGIKYIAAHFYNKKRFYLGRFETEEEAYNTYKNSKESLVKKVAEKWKYKISNNVYDVLLNWKLDNYKNSKSVY